MKIYEFLEEDPSRWIKGALATDAEGHEEDVNSKHACKWCAMGLLNKFYNNEKDLDLYYLHIKNISKGLSRALPQWNDDPETKVEDVIKLFKAIDA